MKITIFSSALVSALIQATVVVTAGTISPRRLDRNSTAWGGVALQADLGNDTFMGVSSTFVLPTPKPSNASSNTGAAAIWVGLDGTTADQKAGLFQAGVMIARVPPVYTAWVEWFPDPPHMISTSDFPVKAGDEINILVSHSLPTNAANGTVTFTNVGTGKKFATGLRASSEKINVKGRTAEWIVEDFQVNGKPAPFLDFGSVVFKDCQVVTTGHAAASWNDLVFLDLQVKNNLTGKPELRTVTNTTLTADGGIRIDYIG